MKQVFGVLLATVAAACLAPSAGLAATGSYSPPRPASSYQTNGRVEVVVISGTTAYLGGKFTSVRPAGASPGARQIARSHAAAIDLRTGTVLPWNPAPNGTVQTIAVSGQTIVMGGSFTRLGAIGAGRLVGVTASTGALVWRAKPNKEVSDVVVSDGVAYAGGAFTRVGSSPRPYLLAVSAATGELSSTWMPAADAPVTALDLSPSGSAVITGGEFTQLDGQAVANLGSLDASTGALTSWRPAFPLSVVSLAADAAGVYVGGLGDGGNFAAFDPVTGATRWLGGTDGNVQAVAAANGVVYVGGHFVNYCGPATGARLCPTPVRRSKLLAIGSPSGQLSPWNPIANSVLGVFALAAGDGYVAVGGDFTRIGGQAQQGFALFPLT